MKPTHAALALALAAGCAWAPAPYPTEVRIAEFADGRTTVVYGASTDAICRVVAAALCDDNDHCLGRVRDLCTGGLPGRIETATRAAWDAMWLDCLPALEDVPRPYLQATRPMECEPLTPFWTGSETSPDRRELGGRPPAEPPPPLPPLELYCRPLTDGDCPDGYACRMESSAVGVCRLAGALPAGAVCSSTSECGEAMHCAMAVDGLNHCYVICDTTGIESDRCGAGQVCAPYNGIAGLCAG